MPIALAAGLIGSSILSGILGRKKKVESTTTLTPDQQRISGQLSTALGRSLDNPSRLTRSDLQPQINQARLGLGRDASAAKQNLEAGLASRGFESSGLLPQGFANIEAQRVAGLSAIDRNVFDTINQDRLRSEQQSIANALQFLGLGGGSQSTTQSGGALGSGLDAGLESLGVLLALQKMGGGGIFGGKT